VPNIACTQCGLTSYAPTPHNAPSPCPYCDAELFPSIRAARGAGAGADDAGTLEAEAA
jgi:predicted Zn-ribbon and HTH transcriptional regulator